MICLPHFLLGLSLLLVDHGAAATAVQRKACRAAAFAASATNASAAVSAAAAAAAVVTYAYLFSVFLKKYDAVLRNANRSFLFSIRDLDFCDLMEFRQIAHRKHSKKR